MPHQTWFVLVQEFLVMVRSIYLPFSENLWWGRRGERPVRMALQPNVSTPYGHPTPVGAPSNLHAAHHDMKGA